MTTVLTQILDRIDAVLRANVPAGCHVYRDRTDAESREEAPSVNVVSRDDRVDSYSGDMDRHTVLVELRIYVRAEPTTPAAELIHAAFHTALVGDAVLKTLADSCRLEGGSFDPQEADINAVIKPAAYRFTYLIAQSSL